MKKIIGAVLCVLLCFSFAACSKKTPGDADVTAADVAVSTQKNPQSSETFEETETTKKQKGSLRDTVKITIPLALLEEKYQKDIKLYCSERGYKKAKINRMSGTVTITMQALSHKLLLTDIGMTVIGAIYDVAGSKDYPYIKEIVSIDEENFRSVVYSVDAKKYQKGSLASYMMAQSCLLYQLYTVDPEYRVDITVVDKKTGKTIETVTYTDKEIVK